MCGYYQGLGGNLVVAVQLTLWCGASKEQAHTNFLVCVRTKFPIVLELHCTIIDNSSKMLDYLKSKKPKKHRAQSPPSKSPLLSPTDEQFLELIVPHDDETPPPLPERHPDRPTVGSTGGAEQVVTENRDLQPEGDAVPEKKDEGETKVKKEHKRWSILQRNFSKKGKKKAAEAQADGPVTPGEG